MATHEIQRAAKPRSNRASGEKDVMTCLRVNVREDLLKQVRYFSKVTGMTQVKIVDEALSSYLWNMKDKYGQA